jgi:dihydrofolate synthase/folylpolyglutamate synthase
MQEVRRGFAEVALPGRFEVMPGRPQVILDVAHNVEAAKTLEAGLAASGFAPEIIAVCGMLRDKDVGGVLRELAPRITRWHLASLRGPRAASAADLAAQLAALGVQDSSIQVHDSPAQAFAAARERASENDKIVVFGSFLTVGEVKAWLNDNKTSKR